MNWDAVGAVGEIIGAAAVVISLVYLASQVRNQNREARLAAMHEFYKGFRDAIASISSDPGLADLLIRANEDYDRLTDGEALRLIAGLQRPLRVWEEAYLQNEHGRLDPRVWDTMVRQLSSLMGIHAFRKTWELRKQLFDDGFRAFVDGLENTNFRVR